MKTKYMLFSLLALTPLMAAAGNDKLSIIKHGFTTRVEDLSKINSLHYSAKASSNPSHYTHLEFDYADGSQDSMDLLGVEEIRYQKDRGENPLKVDMELHYNAATFNIEAPSDVYFRVTGLMKEELEDIDKSAWAEYLVEDDFAYILDICQQYGKDIRDENPNNVFFKGSQPIDWFPNTLVKYDDIPCAVAVYTAEIDPKDGLVLTSEPILFDFTTKKHEIADVEYNISTEFYSNKMTVKVDAVDYDGPFIIERYPMWQLVEYGLEYMMQSSISNYEMQVYKYGATWDEVTFRNHGEKTYSNVLAGEEFLIMVWGLDYGISNTMESHIQVVAPPAAVIDDCQFSLSATQISASEMEIDVVPSNDDTRYIGYIVESSTLSDSYTAEDALANRFYYLTSTNNINWKESPLIHTGAAKLSTHDDLVDGIYLNSSKEYTVIVCGVDENGGRTTEVATLPIQTKQEEENKELTFEVSFSNFDHGNIYHDITATIIPSDKNMTYVAEQFRASNAYANLNRTDAPIIDDYVGVQGKYLRLREGDVTHRFSMASDYDPEADEHVFKEYVYMVFGYDGGATTPLYAFIVNGETGEVRQVRGPGAEAQE